MSIIPASRLSTSDLARLGNNFTQETRRSPQQRRRRSMVAAVNRSLLNLGEQVTVLHRCSPVSAQSASLLS